MARQTIVNDSVEHKERIEALPQEQLGPSQWSYKTVGDIDRGLRSLASNGVIRGNLRAALDTVFHAIGNDAIGQLVNDNDVSGILRVIDRLDGAIPIKELSESNKQKLEEAVKMAEGTVDKVKIDELVAEYEAHLKKTGDSQSAAKALLAHYEKSPQTEQVQRLVDQLQQQQRDIASDLSKLKVSKEIAQKVAEEVAPELTKVIIKATELNIDPVAIREAIEKPIIDAYTTQTVAVEVDKKALETAEKIEKSLKQIPLAIDKSLSKEQSRLLEELAETGKILGDAILFEKAIDQITEEFFQKLLPSDQVTSNEETNAPLVNPRILENTELQKKLKATIAEVAHNSIVLQQTNLDEVMAAFRNQGFDLSTRENEVSKLTKSVQNLAANNPNTATVYIENETYKGVLEGLVVDNGMGAMKAAELATTIAAIYSPANNLIVRSGMTSGQAVAEAMAYNESDMVRKGPEHLNTLSTGAIAVNFNKLRSFAGLGVVGDVGKLQRDVASLKDSRILNKYAPGLASTLRELDPRLVGLLDKIGKSQLIARLGKVGAMFQAVDGVWGRAMLSMATGDFTTAASSFALGLLGKGTLKAGLQAIGTKLAATAAGKAIAAMAANAAPAVGQVVSALLIASTAKDVISAVIPVDKINKFLSDLGINIGGTISGGLKSLGIEGLPNTILTGIASIGSLIGLMTAAIGSVVLIPLAPIIIGVFGVMIGLQMFQSGAISTFVPARNSVGGIGEKGQTYTGPVPTFDPNRPVVEGCPAQELWPASGYITQGNRNGPGSTSHNSGWAWDWEAVDIGTPIGTKVYATHDGYATYGTWPGGSKSGYGNYIIITGRCKQADGTFKDFFTVYGHLLQNAMGSNAEKVTRGQLIAISDNTGNSTGPHVHYSLVGLGSILTYLPEVNSIGTHVQSP